LPDFSLYNIPKRGKCTKLPQSKPNVNKIYRMALNGPNVQKIHQHLPLQDPQKCTQITIFGLKINHLATLLRNIDFLLATFVRPFDLQQTRQVLLIVIRK
jgi:hypothetical protein